jgi:hypothetical protein
MKIRHNYDFVFRELAMEIINNYFLHLSYDYNKNKLQFQSDIVNVFKIFWILYFGLLSKHTTIENSTEKYVIWPL